MVSKNSSSVKGQNGAGVNTKWLRRRRKQSHHRAFNSDEQAAEFSQHSLQGQAGAPVSQSEKTKYRFRFYLRSVVWPLTPTKHIVFGLWVTTYLKQLAAWFSLSSACCSVWIFLFEHVLKYKNWKQIISLAFLRQSLTV